MSKPPLLKRDRTRSSTSSVDTGPSPSHPEAKEREQRQLCEPRGRETNLDCGVKRTSRERYTTKKGSLGLGVCQVGKDGPGTEYTSKGRPESMPGINIWGWWDLGV